MAGQRRSGVVVSGLGFSLFLLILFFFFSCRERETNLVVSEIDGSSIKILAEWDRRRGVDLGSSRSGARARRMQSGGIAAMEDRG
jgi:hypothetical protein